MQRCRASRFTLAPVLDSPEKAWRHVPLAWCSTEIDRPSRIGGAPAGSGSKCSSITIASSDLNDPVAPLADTAFCVLPDHAAAA